jgi:error-prone DNA polymerase
MRYAELYCRSNFSFLEGASHPEELVQRAAELGYTALAITDRNSLAGVVRAHVAAKEVPLKLVIGAEITPTDAPPIVLWATDRAAYGRLSRLITRGRMRSEKGKCTLAIDDLAAFADGLLAGVAVAANDWPDDEPLHRYREIFGDRASLLATLYRGPEDECRLERLKQLSRRTRLPLVAAGEVLYHVPERMVLQNVLTAIRHGTTVAQAGDLLFPNAERHLKPLDELAALYADVPDARRRAADIARQCSFSLDELRYEYPEELAPRGLTPFEYLVQLTWQGAGERYPCGVPDKIRRLVEHELALIEELRYEAYFLTVWDIVRFARQRGILCQGRGSAANSAVCYCLGVTSVDPDRTDMLFERFVSRERNEPPDIDVDFEHERREEVLQYLYEKYGRERAGIAAVVITYRTRSAIRDVGKALGLSLDCVDTLSKNIDGYHHEPRLADRCGEVGVDPASLVGRQFVECVDELVGFPRHLSQHVGGMVMTQGPLCELVPIENAVMPDRTVIQWNKDDLDDLGLLKVDCLALGMLTAIRKCFDLVARHTGRELTLANIPQDEAAVYDMICLADTIGVFQIESRAQMSMLPRLKPRCYYDLVIEVAIVRPGPIQGNMVHPYLRRRSGEETVTYPNEAVREVLEKTLGVPLFQEQAMRLAIVAAGFTPGEADQLRRAMAAWRRSGVLEQFRQRLIDGMTARGLSSEFAEQVFQQIRGFGEYGFPESHAASFALLVYVSAWLKHYYPAAFAAALLNSQPMGFYAPAQLVRDARDHKVNVLPADVNHSDWDCTLEDLHNNRKGHRGFPISDFQFPISNDLPGAPPTDSSSVPSSFVVQSHSLRLGLRMISGMSEKHALAIERARDAGPFTSLRDFTRRTGLARGVLTRLSRADAFGSMGCDRRGALWDTLAQSHWAPDQPLLENLPDEDPPATLAPLALTDQVAADYRTIGLSLRAHPMSFRRAELDQLGVTTAEKLLELPDGKLVTVAGLVLLRQRPGTAKGITFVTIEDETGAINLVVHQGTWDRFSQVTRRSPVWLARGRVQRVGIVVHVVVHRLEDLSRRLAEHHLRSRDFR